MLSVLLADMYDMWQIFTDMKDVGHAGATRRRTYLIFALRGAHEVIVDPPHLFKQLVSRTKEWCPGTRPRDYLTAQPLELFLEEASASERRGCPLPENALRRPHRSWFALLTPREQAIVRELNQAYQTMFGARPERDPDLCYFLGDNPSFSRTWTAHSHRLPTLRRNNGKLWFPSVKRWMTSAEKFLVMGMLSTCH